MTGARPVRVLLVDDDPMVRRGLRMILEGYQQIDVVGEAADGDEVLDRISQHQPAVVLMDLRMHRIDGIRATQLTTALPDPPAVVVMTSFDTDREVLAALRAGASGYLLKDADPGEILAAILGAASAGASLSATVLRQLVALASRPAQAGTAHDQARCQLATLTASERDVAAAVAEGLTNEQIAARLRLAPATVKAYVSRAMTKLHIDGNRVLLALAVLRAER
jgi:DNA-binding NarL/FixJ family response regulator